LLVRLPVGGFCPVAVGCPLRGAAVGRAAPRRLASRPLRRGLFCLCAVFSCFVFSGVVVSFCWWGFGSRWSRSVFFPAVGGACGCFFFSVRWLCPSFRPPCGWSVRVCGLSSVRSVVVRVGGRCFLLFLVACRSVRRGLVSSLAVWCSLCRWSVPVRRVVGVGSRCRPAACSRCRVLSPPRCVPFRVVGVPSVCSAGFCSAACSGRFFCGCGSLRFPCLVRVAVWGAAWVARSVFPVLAGPLRGSGRSLLRLPRLCRLPVGRCLSVVLPASTRRFAPPVRPRSFFLWLPVGSAPVVLPFPVVLPLLFPLCLPVPGFWSFLLAPVRLALFLPLLGGRVRRRPVLGLPPPLRSVVACLCSFSAVFPCPRGRVVLGLPPLSVVFPASAGFLSLLLRSSLFFRSVWRFSAATHHHRKAGSSFPIYLSQNPAGKKKRVYHPAFFPRLDAPIRICSLSKLFVLNSKNSLTCQYNYDIT